MSGRLRLLPATIFILALMLSVRVGNIWTGVSDLGSGVEVRAAAAQQAPVPAAVGAGEGGPEATSATAAPAASSPAAASSPSGVRDVERMTPAEIRLLQELATRRESLDQLARTLDQREALLKAAEQRLVDKQFELERIRAEIESLLERKDGEERERMARLVAIYSNMKPKEAARIFNELDMTVLIDVARAMQERKVAPIVAAMDPERARLLTRELADRREFAEVPQ